MRLSIFVIAVSALALAAPAQRLPWAGHWKFDETAGTIAKDSAFHANDGTLIGYPVPSWLAGKLGGALQFDGVDDHVRINIKKGLGIYDGRGSPYAVTFWVKAPAQNDKRVYGEGNKVASTGQGALFTIGSGRTANTTSDKLQVFIRNNNGQVVINWQSNAIVFDDAWHHVAWVDVAGKGELYIDGVKDTRNWDYTNVANSPRKAAWGTFSLDSVAIGGILRNAPCCLLLGTIDDLRVFATSLTSADVKVIMNGGPGPMCRPSIGLFGSGCGIGPVTMAAGGNAAIGGTLTLQLQKGQPNHLAAILAGGPLMTTDLGKFGAVFAGCRLYTPLQSMESVAIGIIGSQGNSANLSLKIPNNNWLACRMVSFQGATVGGNPPVAGFSNGATVLIGR